MKPQASVREPYQSALDLPSFREMVEQVQGLKALTRFVARKHRKEIIALEQQLLELASTVDDFYERLGPRNWVYNDRLNLDETRCILDTTTTPEEAEKAFINLHRDAEKLQRMVLALQGHTALRSRRHLIERARKEYQAGNWSTATLILLTVMDGFVNDVESKRRGLHAREAEELNAWDSVVGHHLGLSHAHRSFTKTIGKTTDVECFELHRNGIIHGTILNYDNPVVATKAWNRLFAVLDWARSLEKQQVPKDPQPTWRELWREITENAQTQKTLDSWRPSIVAASDPSLKDNPGSVAAVEFLSLWQQKNYGRMASFLSHLVAADNLQKTAGRVRAEYGAFTLEEFTIERLDHRAAALCVIDANLAINGETKPARMRWLRERPDGGPAAPNQDGEWHLMSWGPMAMLNFDPST